MKMVYSFGDSLEGESAVSLLGGKGATLAEMARMSFPVPPGFTIPTTVSLSYLKTGAFPESLEDEVRDEIKAIEEEVGSYFGDKENPLLLSVRSGAPISMPGMMDTILNLGLTLEGVEGLAKRSGSERFAWDAFRRFVQMYGDVVMGLRTVQGRDPFEEDLHAYKREVGAKEDTDLDGGQMKALALRFLEIASVAGKPIPMDPQEQLWGAIRAVFGSWENDRAQVYRRLNGISDRMGTAVNVQAMVFGNLGEDSGTGVAFTRDPSTGKNEVYGEFLVNAQGEDVVAGIRTPLPIKEMEKAFPEAHKELMDVCRRLERHYGDMQDVEFTIQRKKLWMLQSRKGKRSGFAAVRIAVEMEEEGALSAEEALLRIEPDQLEHLLQPVFDAGGKRQAIAEGRLLARGLPAGPGAATGRVVFSAREAEEWARRGQPVILVRPETSPDDIRGMAAARGILTARGGLTSHAALVGRQMGKVCVVGCSTADIDVEARTLSFGGRVLREGNFISLDGTVGQVLDGEIPTRSSEVLGVLLDGYLPATGSKVYQHYAKVMGWADKVRRLGVRTNADQPDQARKAVAFGAEGIGLCRTEHMFFGGDRIQLVREMILALCEVEREEALDKLEPLQRADFAAIFRTMSGRPVTVRLLDPPLHEFLPHSKKEVEQVARALGLRVAEVNKRIESLREENPMLGHRGCRLGIVNPGITRMQARAILAAAIEVQKEGIEVKPEIMVPLVGHASELSHQERVIREVANELFASEGMEVPYLVGTMIELPRAALTAGEIVEHAEFFSFGTNDLTQTTLGVSRDDSAGFLFPYLEAGIIPADPFASLDSTGVGELVKMGVDRGRAKRPDLKVGICGEHGGDPRSISFFHEVGMDYISCSPFRVPVARLAAAQAALKNRTP
ncbi:pyruvate, phosphate dikinase [bacterium]|nr:pyruvate, phosphate dikinase [bacterium]